jgi:hypothetical protein
MTDTSDSATRRARRLLRFYPRVWRARYGEEFIQLLIDDMSERPRSVSRTADVVRTGLLARLASTGLAGGTLEPEQQIRSSLAAIGCALIAFLTFGVAIWSQLTIGWQWSAPAAPATKTAMLVMSAVILVFAVLALLTAIPLVCSLCRAFAQGRGTGLEALVIAVFLGSVVLVVGSIHFGHGWPGTGGHPWAGRDVVPDAVARFCWAATLWITSYWAHPGALASFPPSEIAWMVASPVALLAVLVGAAKMLRRLSLSPRVLRYESWLGTAAALAMAAFLAGASSWIISGGPAPRGLFRVGAIDSVGVVVMAAALILAFRAAQRALAANLIHSPTR